MNPWDASAQLRRIDAPSGAWGPGGEYLRPIVGGSSAGRVFISGYNIISPNAPDTVNQNKKGPLIQRNALNPLVGPIFPGRARGDMLLVRFSSPWLPTPALPALVVRIPNLLFIASLALNSAPIDNAKAAAGIDIIPLMSDWDPTAVTWNTNPLDIDVDGPLSYGIGVAAFSRDVSAGTLSYDNSGDDAEARDVWFETSALFRQLARTVYSATTTTVVCRGAGAADLARFLNNTIVFADGNLLGTRVEVTAAVDNMDGTLTLTFADTGIAFNGTAFNYGPAQTATIIPLGVLSATSTTLVVTGDSNDLPGLSNAVIYFNDGNLGGGNTTVSGAVDNHDGTITLTVPDQGVVFDGSTILYGVKVYGVAINIVSQRTYTDATLGTDVPPFPTAQLAVLDKDPEFYAVGPDAGTYL